MVFVGSFLLLFSVSMAQAANTLMQIGRNPFHQPPLTSPQELITMVQTQVAEVEKGFALAGQSELYESFISQLPTTEIKQVDFAKGSYFQWMFFKTKGSGQVKVARDVTWGNEKTFPGYQVDITKGQEVYTFAVPLGCGNIALMGVKPVAAVNLAPQCGMNVSSSRTFCNDVITVDASGSNDPDGDITGMSVAFVDDSGQVVSREVIESGLVGQVVVPCGSNKLQVTLEDNDGAVSAADQCVADVTGIKRSRFIVDAAYMHQFDPAHYLVGRVGLEYMLTEQLSVLGMVGGAGKVEGTDGTSAMLIDVMAEYKFAGRYFVDLGAGGWITDGDDKLEAEDSQLDGIVRLGARVYGEPEALNVSVFAEVRSAFDEMEDIYDFGRFGLGVQVRF